MLVRGERGQVSFLAPRGKSRRQQLHVHNAAHTVCGLGETNDTVYVQRMIKLSQLTSDSRDSGTSDVHTYPIGFSSVYPRAPSTHPRPYTRYQAHVAALHGALAAAMVALARCCALEHRPSVSGGGLIVSPKFGD